MMAAVLALSLAGATGNASETDNLGVKAYEQGEYAKAIDYFSKESGNMNLSKAERAYACFGIGNSYYRMNKPGLAALNYRRALELSPYFTEAEYNLQFIERKEGAILPANTTENQWLTYIRHDTLGPISILSGAVMLTFLALLTVTRRHGALLTILATLSGLVTVAAVMNYIMYPETPESIPADRLLVVTQNARQTCGGHEQPCAHHPSGIHPAHPARGTRLLVLRQHLPEHARLDTQDGRSAAVALYYPASSSGAASPECRIPGRAAFFQPHSIFFPTEEAGTGKRHILCSKGKTGKSPSGNASEDSPAA